MFRRVVLGLGGRRLGRRHEIRQEPVDNVQRLRGGLPVALQRRRSAGSTVPRVGPCAGAARVRLGREQGDAKHVGRLTRRRRRAPAAVARTRGAFRCPATSELRENLRAEFRAKQSQGRSLLRKALFYHGNTAHGRADNEGGQKFWYHFFSGISNRKEAPSVL